MELSPVEDVKYNGNDFYKYTENKKKGRKYLGLLLNEAGDTEHERGLNTEFYLLLSFLEQALMNPSSERPGEKSRHRCTCSGSYLRVLKQTKHK